MNEQVSNAERIASCYVYGTDICNLRDDIQDAIDKAVSAARPPQAEVGELRLVELRAKAEKLNDTEWRDGYLYAIADMERPRRAEVEDRLAAKEA